MQLSAHSHLPDQDGLEDLHGQEAATHIQAQRDEVVRREAALDRARGATEKEKDENELLHQPHLLKAAEKPVDGLVAAKAAELAEDSERVAVEKERKDIEGLVAAAVEKQKAERRSGAAPGVHADPTFSATSVQVLNLNSADWQLKAFVGGFADGTYGYAIPRMFSAKVARFNLVTFGTVAVLDLLIADTDLAGLSAGFTDGTYGYAVPYQHNTFKGKVARFDLATFGAIGVLDLTTTDTALKGFQGGFTDGTYGYAVPYHNGASFSGKVARFDVATFSVVAVLDLAADDADLAGFRGGFTDDTYGYAVPQYNGLIFGKVARFDLATFSDVAALDLAATDASLKGFIGGFTDGTYGYVVPYNNEDARFGKVVRFDVGTFANPGVLDLTGTDTDLKGFNGGFSDGTYGYVVPSDNGGVFGKVARFDLATFGSVGVLDLAGTDSDLVGFHGGFTDGAYGYVLPYRNSAGFFAKVARFGVHPAVDPEASVVGDPHIVNRAGEHFEIRAGGEHRLLQIPRAVRNDGDLLLRVMAVVEHLKEGSCGGTFMTAVAFSGNWTRSNEALEVRPGSDAPSTALLISARPGFQGASVSLTFGGVGFRVAKHYEGRYGKQKGYLNLRVRGLRKHHDVGGLLGGDSHADAEKGDVDCAPAQASAANMTSLTGRSRSPSNASAGSMIVVVD